MPKARFMKRMQAVLLGLLVAPGLCLAGSIAGFSAGTLQLYQVVFARGTNNEVPATRGDLYA